MTIKTIGLDLAKSVFQAHRIDDKGATVLAKRLHRKQMLPFFSKLPPIAQRLGFSEIFALPYDYLTVWFVLAIASTALRCVRPIQRQSRTDSDEIGIRPQAYYRLPFKRLRRRIVLPTMPPAPQTAIIRWFLPFRSGYGGRLAISWGRGHRAFGDDVR